jgi:mRNA-degrading endonuclease RelE of RelBE toxin-antitoxin system
MNKLPQMASIADLKHRHLEVFERLNTGPVLIANRSKPTAVMVAPALWDKLIDQLEHLQDTVDVLEAKLEFIQSGEQLEEFDADEFPALADVQASTYPAVKSQLRQLRQTNERLYREVEDILAGLKSDPYPPIAEELRDNLAGTWRIKFDGWRFMYEVNEQDRIIVIIKIARRDRDTYRKLT